MISYYKGLWEATWEYSRMFITLWSRKSSTYFGSVGSRLARLLDWDEPRILPEWGELICPEKSRSLEAFSPGTKVSFLSIFIIPRELRSIRFWAPKSLNHFGSCTFCSLIIDFSRVCGEEHILYIFKTLVLPYFIEFAELCCIVMLESELSRVHINFSDCTYTGGDRYLTSAGLEPILVNVPELNWPDRHQTRTKLDSRLNKVFFAQLSRIQKMLKWGFSQFIDPEQRWRHQKSGKNIKA